MLNIQLNGERRELEGSVSVTELLDRLGFTGKRLAVELNKEILPKSLHATTMLNDGDIIEVVGAVGGG
ncbi:sulfur carrier protein ThiS [Hahella ganghwensis]|uniref:sulfur carrier protein ThiS n=1 Tax=Hahella ganghwensis TaxID=286420 RepID=UPI0003816ABB